MRGEKNLGSWGLDPCDIIRSVQMRHLLTLVITGTFLLPVLTGCTSTATVNSVQTSHTYANKVKLKALLYVPDEIENRVLRTEPSTYICSAWKAEVDAGAGYRSAIANGLSAALASVQTVDKAPIPEMAKQEQAHLLVTAALGNENASITVSEGFWSNSINTQFQASVTMTFLDKDGQALYSYVANGAGFGNQSGGCDEIAPALKTSMQTALRQIADYVAQSTYGASPIRDYEKVILREDENAQSGP